MEENTSGNMAESTGDGELNDPEIQEPSEDLESCKAACDAKYGTMTDDLFGANGGLEGGRRRSRRRGFKGSKKSKTRKGNKMLSSWVAFVKKVQHEEKISYSDAMKRASARKKEWKMGQMGGENGPMMSNSMGNSMSNSMGKSMNKSKSQNESQYGGASDTSSSGSSSSSDMGGGRRRRKQRRIVKRRGSKKRGSKKRGSRRSRR
jgi:hypothetical protein